MKKEEEEEEGKGNRKPKQRGVNRSCRRSIQTVKKLLGARRTGQYLWAESLCSGPKTRLVPVLSLEGGAPTAEGSGTKHRTRDRGVISYQTTWLLTAFKTSPINLRHSLSTPNHNQRIPSLPPWTSQGQDPVDCGMPEAMLSLYVRLF